MGAHHISSGTKADRSTGCSLGCSTWPRGYIARTGVGGHCHGDHSELDHFVHDLLPLLSCGTTWHRRSIYAQPSIWEVCRHNWTQLDLSPMMTIKHLNKGFYYVWWWKHSMEVAYQQLQVKGGMFYNDEWWGIVEGWCNKWCKWKEGSEWQLQVKGGMFYNDERWGIVGGWCKKIMQVKGGISSLLWLAESLLWLAPSRRWRLWISIVYITNTPPPTPPVHHPLSTHTDLLCTL